MRNEKPHLDSGASREDGQQAGYTCPSCLRGGVPQLREGIRVEGLTMESPALYCDHCIAVFCSWEDPWFHFELTGRVLDRQPRQ